MTRKPIANSHDRADYLVNIANLLNRSFEALAVIVYGVVALVFTLVYALVASAEIALLLVVLAAGLTYVFQAYQLATRPGVDPNWFYFLLWAAPVVTTVASIACAFLGV